MFDFEKSAAKQTFKIIKDYLSPKDSILDFGSGAGYVALAIQKKFGSKVTCLDVYDFSRTGKTPTLFDGNKIPFKNSSFTTVLCLSVLHHTQNQKTLIKELRRVTRSRILVLEDVPENLFDRILNSLHKIVSRFVYKSRQMKFRTNREWLEFFRKHQLKVEQEVSIGRLTAGIYYPVRRKLYTLKKL